MNAQELVAAIDAVRADPEMTPADLRMWALVCSGCAAELDIAADVRQRRADEESEWSSDLEGSR